MRKARLLAPWIGEERRSAIYHCVSRVVDRRYVFGNLEREQFVAYMRLYEEFCGVRVLSYCVMSNHFHILVEIPPNMSESLSDDALLERLSLLYSDDYVEQVRKQLESLAESDLEKGKLAYVAFREKFTCRMWDLGQFMKILKQRFTRWYNMMNNRVGTLWEARYKSVLVEDGEAARVISAYIDLNPVRAGMVKDPKDYRWCSYAEAVAGGNKGNRARCGIARVFEEREGTSSLTKTATEYDGWYKYKIPEHYRWRSIAGRYRMILFEDGEEVIERGKLKRRGLCREQVERELEREGGLSISSLLRTKTRYFVDGGVIGGKSFVNSVVDSLKGNYLNLGRKSKGSKVLGDNQRAEGMWSMRRLR